MVHRKLTVLLLPLLLLLSLGCHKQVLHPGAINQFDSNSVDSLVVYQAALNQAKANLQSQGGAPPLWPQAWAHDINVAGQAYNTALAGYHTWRDTYLGVQKGDAQALQLIFQTDLQNLANQLTAIFNKAGQKVPGVK